MCRQATTLRCVKLATLIITTPILTSLFPFHQAAQAIKSPTTSFIKIRGDDNHFNIMAAKKKSPTTSADPSSSALNELKETIKSQAAEIDRLKKQLSSAEPSKTPNAKKVPSGGHAHGGTSDNEEILDYKDKTFYAIAYERVWWLAIFLVSLSFTALIMNGFEHTLSKEIELAYFVPLMAGHGGNTGGQAVGTVLSALSAGVISRSDALRVIGKEAMSGLVMGIILGALVGPISHYVMGISMHVSTVVSVTFPLLSTIASFLGSSLPFVCVILGLDPAVIAAPAMTSFVDVSGLMCYFLIANQIFKLFGLEL
mmetsp:Transcript_27877/g.57136  ORF Transcript_27877/g.57136 Transcript_27877/m.57136 type:complete len:312 (-) Transcript_27877:182-1117(-)